MEAVQGDVERADQEIREAAIALSEVNFSGVRFDAEEWRELIGRSLSNEHLDDRLELLARRKPLRHLTMHVATSRRPELLYRLGSYARIGQLQYGLDGATPRRYANPGRLTHGAVMAATALDAGECVATSDIEVPALALWVMGLVESDQDQLRLFGSRRFEREQKKRLARQPGWIAMLMEPRLADLRWLLKDSPSESRALIEIVECSGDTAQQLDAVIGRRAAAVESTDDAAVATVAEFTVEQPEFFWHDRRALHGPRELLEKLVEISAERGDLLVSGVHYMVVEPQGFMDCVLTLAVQISGDHRNSQWHELAVLREVKKSWKPTGRVIPHLEWGDLGARGDRSRVHGEIDVCVLGERLVVDVQAKSPRSSQARQREKVPVVDAAEQHKAIVERMSGSITWLRDGQSTDRVDRAIPIALAGRDLVSITVGTDVVHRWSIGDSPRDKIILTTLDHLRIVNEYLPAALRPVYWLDRQAQEHGSLLFVDEMDYLTKWHRLAVHGAQSVTLRVYASADEFLPAHEVPSAQARFVMADDSAIEHDIAIRSSSALAGSKSAEINRLRHLARAPLLRDLESAAPLLTILQSPSLRESDAYFRIARAILGNTPDQIGNTFAGGRPKVLRQGIERVAVLPEALTPAAAAALRGDGVHLALSRRPRRSGWSVDELEPPEAGAATRRPRFRFESPVVHTI